MDGAGFLQMVNNFEDALTDMRANALFPQTHWLRSAEEYRELYMAALDALVAAWSQDPRDMEKLLPLCADCLDQYTRGQAEVATRFAADINALLYRVKTKAAIT